MSTKKQRKKKTSFTRGRECYPNDNNWVWLNELEELTAGTLIECLEMSGYVKFKELKRRASVNHLRATKFVLGISVQERSEGRRGCQDFCKYFIL